MAPLRSFTLSVQNVKTCPDRLPHGRVQMPKQLIKLVLFCLVFSTMACSLSGAAAPTQGATQITLPSNNPVGTSGQPTSQPSLQPTTRPATAIPSPIPPTVAPPPPTGAAA